MNSEVNFREIGGFPTQEGTVVKTGHFFRSGELVYVAQADQQKLVDDYQIKRIYDFRSAAETQDRQDDSIQGTNYLH
ncbi:tyrosine-protein phosphatase, partial [Enterococcus faecalis]